MGFVLLCIPRCIEHVSLNYLLPV